MNHKIQNITPKIPLALLIALAVLPMVNLSYGQEKQVYKPTGNEGVIEGRISFSDEPPEPMLIDLSADSVCAERNPGGSTHVEAVINDGMLANVFVYVKSDRLDAYSFEVPQSEVVLEHKDCHYAPHVFGIQTEQTLKVTNSDPTVHNTHPTPKENREWNQSQTPGGSAIQVRFSKPELFIPIKCNQHPWEKAYVSVLSHPFFAVSDKSGSYKISGLPPGEYTVVARHEKFGEKQTANILVAANETTITNFTFPGKQP